MTRVRRRCLLLVIAVGLLLSPATSTAAPVLLGPTPYLSGADSPFAGGVFVYFHLEDFEDAALDTPGVTASGGVVLPPGALTDSVDADDGAVDGSGTGGHSWFSNGLVDSFTFSFDSLALGGLPTHVGVVWTDIGFSEEERVGSGGVTFEAFGPGGLSLGVIGPVVLGDGVVTGTTAEDRFFGVRNPAGILRITIAVGNSVDWEVDHLQYGRATVPEPTVLALLACGLLGGLAHRRHRRAGPWRAIRP